jgi:hypothetical protein
MELAKIVSFTFFPFHCLIITVIGTALLNNPLVNKSTNNVFEPRCLEVYCSECVRLQAPNEQDSVMISF